MMDYQNILADRAKNMEASAIRELLKLANVPGMISLAGGLPATESFPFSLMPKLNDAVLSKYGPNILQYGLTEGLPELRAALVTLLHNKNIDVTADDILVTCGAMSAIDAVAKVLTNKGDLIAVEEPTFLATLKCFKAYEAQFITIPTDEHGIIPGEYEKILKRGDVKFSYLIPTFQNPTGVSLSSERREIIAELLKKYSHLAVEDDPYYELRYSGKHLTPIYTLAPDNVVHIGTFSKIFSPGLRLGYYLGPKQITSLMTSSRQAVDVHAATYSQALAAELISSGEMAKHIPTLIDLYKPRLQKMLDELEVKMPAEFSWTKPEGGMFVWLSGPKETFNAEHIYSHAIEQKVAFVPGKFFFVNQKDGLHTIRLNFTNVSEDQITEGISRLAAILE